MSADLKSYIDATLLRATTTSAEIEILCTDAISASVWSVCIPPHFVSLASRITSSSEVKVCTVIGFPLGNTSTKAKSAETEIAISNGADEIDMVIQQGALLSGEFKVVESDIKEVVAAASGRLVKVIIECAHLPSDSIKETAAKICVQAGAHFVKTSTGFATSISPGGVSGATIHDIKLIKGVVPNFIGVKASGGIKTRAFCEELINAGATRLGTSSMKEILFGETVNTPNNY